MTGLLVALGAGPGALARFLVAHRLDTHFPRGTLLVNLSGAFLLGLFTGWSLSGHAWALLGTGFCGAFTTYSSFAVQAVGLGRRLGTAYAVVTVFWGLAACALGFWLAG